ncbi:MAG: CCA tRNA nucleotidyltransferase [Candidatus Melainabacteria bacterium]|nr:CCA tRNA nucleotidyltransferase [Candidatus Melainabacteria bacterium]
MKKNIKDKLQEIEKDHYELLINIGKVSKEHGLRSYLVGGMVRDILLGFSNLDIDIVVENDAKRLADALVKKFPNCELSAKHDRFHTAKLIFNISGNKIPVDLASTRQEVYEHPAALPKVRVSDLEKDLYRRDFTINALAVSLMPEEFGDVIDLFDGLIDLKQKQIKVLHDLSFIDDPTRMIRAIRFACKLGFEIEKNTWLLLKKTIDSKQFDNLIENIRGDRVKIEIRYLFNLPNIHGVVKLFFESGIYRMISVELKFCRDVWPCVSTNVSCNWLIHLALIIQNLKPDTQEKIMKNLQLTSDETKIIKSGLAAFNRLQTLHANKKQIDSVVVYRELRDLAFESVAIVKLVLSTQHSALSSLINEYIETTSKIKLEITGQDLISIGLKEGKQIGEILEKVLEKKIKDPKMKKEDEINLAHLFLGY